MVRSSLVKKEKNPRIFFEQRVDVRMWLHCRPVGDVEALVVVSDAPDPVSVGLPRDHHHQRHMPHCRVLDPTMIEELDQLRVQLHPPTADSPG